MVVGLQDLIEILRNICRLIAATGQVLRYSVGEHWSRVPMVVQSAALLRAAAWRRDGLRLGEERRKGVQVGRIGRGSWLRTAIACLAPAPLCAAIVEHHDLARCEGRLRELFEVPQSLLGIATSVAGAIAVSFPLSAHHASAIWDEPHRPCGAPMSDRVAAVTKTSSPSIEPIMFAWSWRGTPIPVVYELSGPAGAEPILMLPAMSTVSTRDELRALAHHLETRRCVITDWPGFGDTARPRLDYDRDLCRGFLEDLVAHLQRGLNRPSFPVVACGHAAGYAIDLEARQPGTFTHLVLIAPTWRGPLPTMMSGRKPIQAAHPAIDPRADNRGAALPAERLPARRADDVPQTRVRRSHLLDRRPPCRSHAPDPPARRPLCFGLLRHRRPRPVRRPRRLPCRGPTRSSPDPDALRARYATQVSGRNGSARGPAGHRNQAAGSRHAWNGRGACGRLGTADRRLSLGEISAIGRPTLTLKSVVHHPLKIARR